MTFQAPFDPEQNWRNKDLICPLLTCSAKSILIRVPFFAADRQRRCAHNQELLANPQGFKSFLNKLQFVKKPPKWCCARKLKQAQKDGVTFHHLPVIIMSLPCKCLIDCTTEPKRSCHNPTEIIPKLYLHTGRLPRSVLRRTNFEHTNFLVAEWQPRMKQRILFIIVA
jgi:hypothetical protein